MRVGYALAEIGYKIKDLLRDKKRLAVFCIVAVLGLVFGFRNGFKTDFDTTGFFGTSTLIYRMIADKINVFTFIVCQALILLLFGALFCLGACHKVCSYIVAVLLFYRTYMFAYMIVLLVSVFRLLILPYLLVCFIPFCLVYLALFILLALFVGEICDCGYRGFCFKQTLDCFPRLIPLGIVLVALSIVEGILTLVLTFGIIC